MANGKGEQRRRAIVRSMIAHYAQHGVWPTMDETARALSLPKSGVFFHLDALAKLGYVERIHGLSRATWVTTEGREWLAGQSS